MTHSGFWEPIFARTEREAMGMPKETERRGQAAQRLIINSWGCTRDEENLQDTGFGRRGKTKGGMKKQMQG